MKYFALLLLSFALLPCSSCSDPRSQKKMNGTAIANDSVLRHVVLFQFKKGTSQEAIKKVADTFSALPSKIPQIKGYEWGVNNSPEALEKGFYPLLLFNLCL